MIDTNQAYNFIIDNEICTEAEADLVTAINGFNIEAINDIIYCRTGYHDIEQLHDCEPKNFNFDMVYGLEDEDEDEEPDEDETKELTAKEAAEHVIKGGRVTIKSKGTVWGCDFYKKNGNIYAYNTQIGECIHKSNFDFFKHFSELTKENFVIIKSDNMPIQCRQTLHKGDN